MADPVACGGHPMAPGGPAAPRGGRAGGPGGPPEAPGAPRHLVLPEDREGGGPGSAGGPLHPGGRHSSLLATPHHLITSFYPLLITASLISIRCSSLHHSSKAPHPHHLVTSLHPGITSSSLLLLITSSLGAALALNFAAVQLSLLTTHQFIISLFS